MLAPPLVRVLPQLYLEVRGPLPFLVDSLLYLRPFFFATSLGLAFFATRHADQLSGAGLPDPAALEVPVSKPVVEDVPVLESAPSAPVADDVPALQEQE